MNHSRTARNVLVLLAALMLAAPTLAQSLLTSPPAAPYVSVSSILPLPDFIPGAGALFIDPANAPVGPWLSYGTSGNLVEVLFMVPLSALDAAESYDDLGAALLAELGATVDHVDITYNGGHPGMAEPHYHVRLSLVAHDAQVADLSGN